MPVSRALTDLFQALPVPKEREVLLEVLAWKGLKEPKAKRERKELGSLELNMFAGEGPPVQEVLR